MRHTKNGRIKAEMCFEMSNDPEVYKSQAQKLLIKAKEAEAKKKKQGYKYVKRDGAYVLTHPDKL